MAEPRWPLYTALLASVVYAAAVQTGAYHPSGNSVADAVVFLTTAPAVAALSVALGLLPSRVNSLLGIATLTAALQWGGPNPLPAMITIGFWLVGLAVRSHRRLDGALRARADELESSRAAYTEEALRYEHVRIARELHDIVAHSLSVIVIQASAGRRLPANDPTSADLFETISELTDQVRADIDGLSNLLARSAELASSNSRQSIEELIARTVLTGSPVTCHLPDDFDQLPGRLAVVVHRVVQEGLTNAIKHAPGAPIDITVRAAADVCVVVTNTAPRAPSATPAAPGSGRGISGLTERVHAVEGTFTSGPTSQGGWRLSAEVPRAASRDRNFV